MVKHINAVGFIFARGGSKGLPGKNTRSLGGKPLIAWAIEQGKSVARIRRLIVSTDSAEIAEVAQAYGAEVPFLRPAELAKDDSDEWSSWRHALDYLKDSEGCLPEIMVSIPATAPLRLPQDVDDCLDQYLMGGVDMVITVTEAHRNPYFNMVKSNSDGSVGLVISPQGEAHARRQDAPVVYDMTTLAYVVDPLFVMRHASHFEGRVRAIQVPPERAIDIDTLLDFEIAEMLIKKREKQKNESK